MGDAVAGKALAARGPGRMRPYLRTKNVFDGRIDLSDVLHMPMTDVEFERYRLRYGDVLLNEGQSIELVGRCAMYKDENPEPCAIQNQLVRFRARQGVSESFAAHLFRYSQQRGIFSKIALQTTSVAHLGVSRFQRLQLGWPGNIKEQEAIAEALSDIDVLIETLERLVRKKRDLRNAALKQLLTPPLSDSTCRSDMRGHWEATTLGAVAEVKTGPFGSSLHESDYVDNGTPIITVEHLGDFGIEHRNLPLVSDFDRQRLRTYSLEVGDIVFSRVGSVDRNALVRESEAGWLFSGRLLRVRLYGQKAHAPFLSYQFHGEQFKSAVRNVAVGQTMACLNTQILKGICVFLPPFSEQVTIAKVLSDMDVELLALEQRREKTQALKQAMMQVLLTGTTRLVKPESMK